MASRKKLNVGIVGYGFMGRAHSNAFARVNQFFDVGHEPVLKAVCGRDQEKVEAFRETWSYESCETGWRRLVARRDIDLIDIAAPNDVHAEIALAAVAAGKMVMCEKPLGRNAAEAASMAGAVERAQVPNMVWYNYRRVPAVALAKQLIDEGRLGRIYHYRAKFLQDWKAKAWLLSLWASKTCAVSRAKPGMRSCSNRRVVTLLHRSIAVSRWRAARRRRPSRRRNAS